MNTIRRPLLLALSLLVLAALKAAAEHGDGKWDEGTMTVSSISETKLVVTRKDEHSSSTMSFNIPGDIGPDFPVTADGRQVGLGAVKAGQKVKIEMFLIKPTKMEIVEGYDASAAPSQSAAESADEGDVQGDWNTDVYTVSVNDGHKFIVTKKEGRATTTMTYTVGTGDNDTSPDVPVKGGGRPMKLTDLQVGQKVKLALGLLTFRPEQIRLIRDGEQAAAASPTVQADAPAPAPAPEPAPAPAAKPIMPKANWAGQHGVFTWWTGKVKGVEETETGTSFVVRKPDADDTQSFTLEEKTIFYVIADGRKAVVTTPDQLKVGRTVEVAMTKGKTFEVLVFTTQGK